MLLRILVASLLALPMLLLGLGVFVLAVSAALVMRALWLLHAAGRAVVHLARHRRRPRWRIEDADDSWTVIAPGGERIPGAWGGSRFLDRRETERWILQRNRLADQPELEDAPENVAPFGKPIICYPHEHEEGQR